MADSPPFTEDDAALLVAVGAMRGLEMGSSPELRRMAAGK